MCVRLKYQLQCCNSNCYRTKRVYAESVDGEVNKNLVWQPCFLESALDLHRLLDKHSSESSVYTGPLVSSNNKYQC